MSKDIKHATLGDIGPVKMCKRVLKSQTNTTGGIPFYKIATFGNTADTFITEELYQTLKSNYSFPKKGAILISAAGTLGRTVIYDGNPSYFQDSNIVWIEHNEKDITEQFLYYYYQLAPWKKTSGSTIDRLYNDNIRNTPISYPQDIAEQKKIASILKAIDEKIELNNKINAELETLAKTIYDYWFVQFEFSDENGKPYKSNGGKMVYNEQLKREIPEGWSATTLSEFIDREKGGDWGKEQEEGNYNQRVTCIRGADFPGLHGKASLVAPERYILEKNKIKILDCGDIIVEISGGSPTQSTGRIAYINSELLNRFANPIITSNFCKAFTLKNPEHQYWFYLLWNKLYNSGVLFKYEGKTTGIKNLLFDVFCKDYMVVLPKDIIVKNYNKIVEPFFIKIQNLNRENQHLATLRDWLLPMLMNGQVSVE